MLDLRAFSPVTQQNQLSVLDLQYFLKKITRRSGILDLRAFFQYYVQFVFIIFQGIKLLFVILSIFNSLPFRPCYKTRDLHLSLQGNSNRHIFTKELFHRQKFPKLCMHQKLQYLVIQGFQFSQTLHPPVFAIFSSRKESR